MTSYLNTGNMEYKMYYKDWKLGGTKSSKASILLELEVYYTCVNI